MENVEYWDRKDTLHRKNFAIFHIYASKSTSRSYRCHPNYSPPKFANAKNLERTVPSLAIKHLLMKCFNQQEQSTEDDSHLNERYSVHILESG